MTSLFPVFEGELEPRLALEVEGQRLDRIGLFHTIAEQRQQLIVADLQPGDRVGVWTQGALETPVALAANALAGLVSVPLNPALGERELEHVLKDAAPRLLLAADPDAVRARTPGLQVLPIVKAPARLSPRAAPPPASLPDDHPLLLVYTSGSTGAPKGVLLTRRNVIFDLDALLKDAWGMDERDTIVHALPLFHVHGLVLGLFGALRLGAALRWLPRFDPAGVCRALSETGGVLFAVPTMYHRLAEACEQDGSLAQGLRAARLLVSGSAPLPAREHARLERLSGQRPIERYGLTETLIVCSTRRDGERRPGSVGLPLRGLELRLVDEQRRPIEARDGKTLGEVAVRGPSVMRGYLGLPEATRAALDDEGWFYTGDLATIDADGFVCIVGRRATDLIKTGGFKVGAGEVEAALLEHPEVREAAVVGLPDEDLGERIEAFVVPADPSAPPSEEALIAHVARRLSPHKRPRSVHLVAELPRNALGKVLKPELRARLLSQ